MRKWKGAKGHKLAPGSEGTCVLPFGWELETIQEMFPICSFGFYELQTPCSHKEPCSKWPGITLWPTDFKGRVGGSSFISFTIKTSATKKQSS